MWLFPFSTIDREMVEYLKGLIESGQFTPVVDRTYPLEEIVDAYRYVETQQKIGNVVITITGANRHTDDPRALLRGRCGHTRSISVRPASHAGCGDARGRGPA